MQLDRSSVIAVLMGGISNEREISFKSGKAVATALRETGHEVVPVDITDANVDALDNVQPRVAFVALHGEFGEDGQVQEQLEQKDIPYTGSGPQASRFGMDKVTSKRLFVRNSVPTPDYMVVERDEDRDWVAAAAQRLGYPLVCKPSTGGSSIGITIVEDPDHLQSALDEATENATESRAQSSESPVIMLERHIHGREFTVGVLDGEPLPVVEVRSGGDFFDYDAKYSDDSTEYIVPVAVLETLYRRMQDAAVRAYEALGCRHLARIDMMLGYDGQLYVLEANTIPGFTPRSLLPKAAAHAGIEFPELCENICAMAIRDSKSNRYSSTEEGELQNRQSA